jgi:glutaconate CoA-transferase subunit B
MTEASYTIDELMVSQIARFLEDDDIVFQGFATFLVFAALVLAKLTHAPDLYFFFSVGNSLSDMPGRAGISRIEELTLDTCLKRVTMTEINCDLAPSFRALEFMRPAQVDSRGNFNNTAIGSFEQPKVRLPGGAGIPDSTNFNDRLMLYVPRHTTQVFVEKIDFRTGLGYGQPGADRSFFSVVRGGPSCILTELCIFDFEEGQARLSSLHPGVKLEEVKARTGFRFETRSPLQVTEPPSATELRLIREEIDPFGVRRLEFLSGEERLAAIERILSYEESG